MLHRSYTDLRKMTKKPAMLFVTLVFSLTSTSLAKTPIIKRPLNIAHRGSSGTFPEHTIEAYRQAIKDGADFIECDVCVTKDLKLVCRHESWLNDTTNIWENATLRLKQNTYHIQSPLNGLGKTITDVFTVDLTLEELRSIRARQRYSFRDPNFDDKFQIPTLEEFIQVAKSARRPIGIYPEAKDPQWVNSLDILQQAKTTFEDLLVDVLHRNGYLTRKSPCYIQSFSEDSIRAMSTKTKLPLIMLMGTPLPVPEDELEALSEICYGIGVHKYMIQPVINNILQDPTDLVANAHKYNLKVHGYTFKNEDEYLAWNFTQDPYNEYETYFNTQIDGYFTDFPSTLKRFLDVKIMLGMQGKSKKKGKL